jgi:hypothetical protein
VRDGRSISVNWQTSDHTEIVWLAAGSGFSASNEQSVRRHTADDGAVALDVQWGHRETRLVLEKTFLNSAIWEQPDAKVGFLPLVR